MRASNSITQVSLGVYCALRCTFDVILQWRASNQQLIGARKAEERFIELTVGILESMRLTTIRCQHRFTIYNVTGISAPHQQRGTAI